LYAFLEWPKISMPVCKSTFGAFVRSRAPFHFSTSKTLVPFLYQTATIQQWKPAAQPIARRNVSSRTSPDDDIPFENAEGLSPAVDTAAPEPEPSRKKTITGPERAAFEKLYQRAKAEEIPHNGLPFKHEVDQIADEWYEEDDDTKDASSIDKVFDSVLSGGMTTPSVVSRQKKVKKPREDLQSLAESILKPEIDAAKNKRREEAAAQVEKIRNLREEDKARVTALLEKSGTDRELWDILEREVFYPVRKMNLDGLNGSIKIPITTKASSTASTFAAHDRRIVFPNFPTHLITAAQLLRDQFPSSPLLLTILPTLKSLGRSSYALGATTTLYNLLIRTVWVRYSNYDHINELLTDMDNGGIEFDPDTLALLDNILNEYKRGCQGRYGSSLYAMFRMEHFTEGIKRVQIWREEAARRLGAWTAQRAAEGKLIKRYNWPLHQPGQNHGSYNTTSKVRKLVSSEKLPNETMPSSVIEVEENRTVNLEKSRKEATEKPVDGLEALIQSSDKQSKKRL
jgi:hypothetical protein